jgi:hypothetical protein
MRVTVAALIVSAVVVSPTITSRTTASAVVALQDPSRTASAQNYAFPSGAGMLFFYVKPDRTADFESVVTRLAETLDRAEDPVRRQQATGWRILRSVETTKDAAIYVFVFDPAVPAADYDPVKILSEGQPADIQPLYEKLRDATIRVERMGLTKLR